MYCSVCFNETTSDPCAVCTDPDRDRSRICVVATPEDAAQMEQAGFYRGLYHVLHGTIQPLAGITADTLRIRELLERIKPGETETVILFLPADLAGEATAMYLSRVLAARRVHVSRMARGQAL